MQNNTLAAVSRHSQLSDLFDNNRLEYSGLSSKLKAER
jgi:hypothetical protein